MGSPLFVTERSGPADGPIVAMVHGTLDRHASFIGVRRELEDRTTVLYDRRGYGRSRAAGVASTLDDHADDLLTILDGREAVVLGHSFGGCVALRAATTAPAIVRALVVFEAPLPWLPGWPGDTGGAKALAAPNPVAAAESFFRYLIGDERWEALPDRAKDDRRAEGAALVSDMRCIRPAEGGGEDPIDLTAVVQPVVIGRGERSKPHQIAGSQRLSTLVADGELVTVPGATHGAHASHPVEVAAMVRRAIERVSP